MPTAGAVGGITPAQSAATQDAAARTAGGTAEARPAASSAAAAPDAAGKPAAAAPADPAIALAATLAGLKVGQEVRGQARPLPGRPQALLTTPEGEFLIDPAPAMQGETDLTVVLTRADRSIGGLLLAADGEALDPPQPMRLTLLAVPSRPAAPDEAQVQPIPAAPAQMRPAQPHPLPLPLPLDDAALNSLLPGEALPLRGRGAVAGATLPPPALTPKPAAQPAVLPAPLPARGQALPPSVPRALSLGLPSAMLQPASTGTPAATPAPAAPALTALLEEGILSLRLETPVKGQSGLSASLIAIAAPGEITPLTRPAEGSPLARLQATGRLVTAVALPAADVETAAMPVVQAQPNTPTSASATPAPAPRPTGTPPSAPPAPALERPAPAGPAPVASGQGKEPHAIAPRSDSSQPQQPVRLSANGAVLHLDLPASAPRPQAGTQFVFLITNGREALPPARAATAERPPEMQPAAGRQDAVPQPDMRGPRAAMAAPPAPPAPEAKAMPGLGATPSPTAAAAPVEPRPTAPAARQEAPPVQAPAVQAPPVQAPPARAPATSPRAPEPGRPAATDTPGGPAAPQGTDRATQATPPPPPAELPWVPGMSAPLSLATAQPLPTHPGEALLLAVMQAFGRKGFNVSPHTDLEDAREAQPAKAADAARIMTRLAAAPATDVRPAMVREALTGDPLPDALPVTVMLQTPHGPLPLALLVWQQPRPEEDGGHDGAADGADREVCFAVEVNFEKLGVLRLRGAVTPKHLQLGVETERTLDAALQRSATEDFNMAVEAGGMTGTLVFRHRQGR